MQDSATPKPVIISACIEVDGTEVRIILTSTSEDGANVIAADVARQIERGALTITLAERAN